MMKKVLVIFHVFYDNQVPYFIEKMKTIRGVEWDLVVTGSNLARESADLLASFKEDVSFISTKNRGYDVAPFIEAVKSVDLDKYSFVIKLHTKNLDDRSSFRHNGDNLTGYRWRNTMVDALIGTPASFDALVRAFENEKTGLVYSLSVNMVSRGSTIEDSSLLVNEMERLGMKPQSMDYCAGTIFAIRAEALRYLQDSRVDVSAFDNTGPSHSKGTLAHSYERIFCIASSSMGLTTVLVPKSKRHLAYYKVKRAVEPTLEWIFSVNHFGDRNEKFLKIFGMSFNLSRLFHSKSQSISE